jgi:hypothetical protein
MVMSTSEMRTQQAMRMYAVRKKADDVAWTWRPWRVRRGIAATSAGMRGEEAEEAKTAGGGGGGRGIDEIAQFQPERLG